MGSALLLGGVYTGRRMALEPANQPDTGAGAAPAAGAVRQKWTLTQDALDKLLATLGDDRDAAGARYLEIRRHLVRLFEWRGCSTPDEYADETINRCARKLSEGEEIRDVATYCIGIARMVVREMLRDRSLQTRPLEDAPEPRVPPAPLEMDTDGRAECLRSCLERLSPETRNLILHYYQGDKGDKIRTRKGLIDTLGIPASTLRMRALRVRERLQSCSSDCMKERTAGGVM
jgi:DNA-directed RNA polymerase specialized sigma24 family protein